MKTVQKVKEIKTEEIISGKDNREKISSLSFNASLFSLGNSI